MSRYLVKYISILLVLIINPDIGNAQIRPLYKRNHSVNKLLNEVISSPNFKTAGFAFYAYDMKSGELIASVNPHLALRPASTLKLLTTATALELYGPDHKFETKLLYTERMNPEGNKEIENIIIKGGGDPSLGSEYFKKNTDKSFIDEWSEAIKMLAIDSLHGQIIGDASIFSYDMIPPSWSWMNMGQYYGAGPCGLSIYDNFYTLYFNTSDSIGGLAQIDGVYPDLSLNFDNTVTSDSITWDNSYIYGAPYNDERTIRGTLPLNRTRFSIKGSMPDPAYTAAVQLDSIVKSQLMVTAGSPTTMRLLKKEDADLPQDGVVFHTSYSPSLFRIIRETNTESVNLFAEHCLIHSGIKLGAAPETTIAADSLISFWKKKGMDTQGIAMYDGSGLSQYNAITPYQMVWLLRYMKQESPYFTEFYNSMAVAGNSGTLKSLFKQSAAEGQLRAKSGTINHVKAYAGYVKSLSGRDIAFSMAVNGFSGTSREARAKLEQLMIALAEFSK